MSDKELELEIEGLRRAVRDSNLQLEDLSSLAKDINMQVKALRSELVGRKEESFENYLDCKFPAIKLCDAYYAVSKTLKATNRGHYAKLFQLWDKGEF